VICEECGNADGNAGLFLASTKVDDRLSKDNLKFYRVKWVYGGKQEYAYPKITLKVGDVVMTEALGIDITLEGKKYKIFDTDFIVSKVKDENMDNKIELISDSGKTHAIVENPEDFKKAGIDIIGEMKTIMEQQEILDSEGNDNG
jgi:co-chaperonin GroES (HSP10)